MAETQSFLQRNGLTRGKAAVITVLAVVLLGVVYIQYGSSDADVGSEPVAYTARRRPAPPPTAERQSPSTAGKQPSEGGAESTAPALVDPSRWQSPPLEDVIAHDPFALPEIFPRTRKVAVDPSIAAGGEAAIAAAASDAEQLADAVERLQKQLDELTQRGVHVIVRERDQYAAMIGDRLIYVGDKIDGFTVTAIGPDGVQVEGKVGR